MKALLFVCLFFISLNLWAVPKGIETPQSFAPWLFQSLPVALEEVNERMVLVGRQDSGVYVFKYKRGLEFQGLGDCKDDIRISISHKDERGASKASVIYLCGKSIIQFNVTVPSGSKFTDEDFFTGQWVDRLKGIENYKIDFGRGKDISNGEFFRLQRKKNEREDVVDFFYRNKSSESYIKIIETMDTQKLWNLYVTSNSKTAINLNITWNTGLVFPGYTYYDSLQATEIDRSAFLAPYGALVSDIKEFIVFRKLF